MLWSSEQPPLPPRLSTWFVHTPLAEKGVTMNDYFYLVLHMVKKVLARPLTLVVLLLSFRIRFLKISDFRAICCTLMVYLPSY